MNIHIIFLLSLSQTSSSKIAIIYLHRLILIKCILFCSSLCCHECIMNDTKIINAALATIPFHFQYDDHSREPALDQERNFGSSAWGNWHEQVPISAWCSGNQKRLGQNVHKHCHIESWVAKVLWWDWGGWVIGQHHHHLVFGQWWPYSERKALDLQYWNAKTEDQWKEIFRPEGKALTVEAPIISCVDNRYSIDCPTPGSSIVYRVVSKKEFNDEKRQYSYCKSLQVRIQIQWKCMYCGEITIFSKLVFS